MPMQCTLCQHCYFFETIQPVVSEVCPVHIPLARRGEAKQRSGLMSNGDYMVCGPGPRDRRPSLPSAEGTCRERF